jgi:uncharacterized protein
MVLEMQLISSGIALKEIIALVAAGELPLADLAAAVEARPSTAQRGLALLLADRLVNRVGERPVYRVVPSELTTHVVSLALLVTPVEVAARIAGRANPALEFVAVREGTLVVVFSSYMPSSLVGTAATFLARLAESHDLPLHCLDHRDLRRELLPHPELRDEMRQARILHGDLNRSFPDRRQHGMTTGRRLGRLHPSLRPPSRRQLGRLARRHRVRSLQVFGSAVRSDFRPDSDVDVLVRFQPDAKPSLFSMASLGDDLEAALGRDVDLLREEGLGPEIKERALAEAVSLL